ncbi:Pycsar system effector family protein [Streptosporangium canum]|uniref:Pycsar system effector family protein n=1 Tax=Streptosporangium canum TaxID=324952 RepID=UPI00343A62B9
MTPTNPPASTVMADERQRVTDLQTESTAVRAELTRVDGKAGLLLSWAGGAFAVVAGLTAAATSTARLPGLALVGLWGVAGLLATAVTVLLVAVRPRIPRTGGTGFIAHARAASAHDLLCRLDSRPETAAADVWLLSRLAVAKYRRIRLAVDLLIGALALLAIVLPLTHR